MSQPTDDVQWSTDSATNVLEPSTGQKQAGFNPGDRLPAGWENWWKRAVSRWIKWLNDTFLVQHTTTGTHKNITATGLTVTSEVNAPGFRANVGDGFTLDGDISIGGTGMYSFADGDLGLYSLTNRKAEIKNANDFTLRARSVTPILNSAGPANQLELCQRNANNNVLAWANIDSTGTLNAGWNIASVSHPGTGSYTVTFSQSIDQNSVAVATPLSPLHVTAAAVAGGGGSVGVLVAENGNGVNAQDASFYLIVLGLPHTMPTQDL